MSSYAPSSLQAARHQDVALSLTVACPVPPPLSFGEQGLSPRNKSQGLWPKRSAQPKAREEPQEEEKAMAALAVAPPPTFSGSGSPERGRLDLHTLLAMPLAAACAEVEKLPAPTLEVFRTTLWDILGTVGRKEEFLALQRVLAARTDLNLDALSSAPLPLGKILVAVRTGIQAFLHPSVQMSQLHLAEIFLQKRCKNMACQSHLPVGDCACIMCRYGLSTFPPPFLSFQPSHLPPLARDMCFSQCGLTTLPTPCHTVKLRHSSVIECGRAMSAPLMPPAVCFVLTACPTAGAASATYACASSARSLTLRQTRAAG